METVKHIFVTSVCFGVLCSASYIICKALKHDILTARIENENQAITNNSFIVTRLIGHDNKGNEICVGVSSKGQGIRIGNGQIHYLVHYSYNYNIWLKLQFEEDIILTFVRNLDDIQCSIVVDGKKNIIMMNDFIKTTFKPIQMNSAELDRIYDFIHV